MTHRLLIVEDTPAIARIQKHIAHRAGYQADIAASLAEASDKLKAHDDYCLAIVDFILPDADNGQAIPLVLRAKVPTIVMTGKLDSDTRDAMAKLPIIDYVTKENRQAYNYLEDLITRLRHNHLVKILVVDDSRSARNHLQALLARHNYQVLLAEDGKEALDVIHQHPDIKVVITDNEMPNMDGIRLTNAIRQEYSNEQIAVIGISGSSDNYMSARYLKNGADDYLRKPFNAEEFYCRVSQNIDHIDNIRLIREQANCDYLTKLPNRRYFFEVVEADLAKRAKREALAIVAMMDIDHFKSINDNYGHDGGDEVLRTLSAEMSNAFKDDLVARLGGEEFAIYFFHEDLEKADETLEHFRAHVASKSPDFNGLGISFTLSIGLTSGQEYDADALLKRADEHLYTAKESGRNVLVSDADDPL